MPSSEIDFKARLMGKANFGYADSFHPIYRNGQHPQSILDGVPTVS